nr:MAG TPA: hypothetical protein [Crassvirales sp.]
MVKLDLGIIKQNDMDAVGIVEVLNTKFESMNCKKGVHFILHKEIECNSFSKAYKEYKWDLWYINNGEKSKVTTLSNTSRVITEKEESEMTKYMEESLLTFIFNLLLDHNNLTLMLNGRYKGVDTD